MNEKEKLDILLKKWELLFNHYKNQDGLQERRRNFLWILQAFLFTAIYYLSNNESNMPFYVFLRFSIPFIGLIFSFALLFVLRRHWRSLLLTEQALRDVEKQLRNHNDKNYLGRFTIDK